MAVALSRILSLTIFVAQSIAAASSTLSAAEFASREFDVLILGGGTAGLVVANRLSAPPTSKDLSPLRVGIIEAGQYLPEDPLINVPTAGNLLGNANVGTLIGNPTYDWLFESVPQPGLDGLVIQYPRYSQLHLPHKLTISKRIFSAGEKS
jgi:choline dehydrogenase-like flavoprotein